jgi:tetratricopeptide (TPR) repeat protein
MPGRWRFAIIISLATLVLLAGCTRTPQEKYARFLQRGKKLLQESKPARAVVEFRSAMQQQPKAPEGYYWLAQAFLAQERVADAVAALRKATELKPGYAPAQLKLAELMVRSRDQQLLKDAEARIQKILTDNPGDDDALVTLAAAEAQLGNTGDAEKYLKEAMKKSPDNLRPKIALALVKVTENDLGSAEELLKATAKLAPSSDDVAVALGHLETGMGKTTEAAAVFQKAIGINADNTSAWISLGSLQLEGGDIKAAEQSFKRAAESPKSQAPLAYVVFLIRQNRRAEAIRNLERMFKTTPENPVVRSALVAGYITANRQLEAQDILNAAIKKDPNDLEALLQQSQIYIRRRRLKEALADLNVALTVSPTSPQAHFLRSRIYWMKGNEIKRREDLAATLRMAPDSLSARIELADALLQTQKAQEALTVLNQATDEQKRTLAFVVAYNWALIGMGDLATARKDVDRSLAAFKSPQLLLQDAALKMTKSEVRGHGKATATGTSQFQVTGSANGVDPLADWGESVGGRT